MGYKHNKEDILETGYQVLRKNGYHDVGINQILKEAGIPKGSFYNFFESKEDFARQVVEYYGCNNSNWIKTLFDESTETPINKLKSFYKLLVSYNEQDNYNGGCLVNSMSNEVGRNSDTLAAELDKQFKQWLVIIKDVVKEGQELEEITTKYSSMEIAEYLHSGFFGTFSRMKVTRSRTYMDVWIEMTFNFIKA
ncbi:TetR/AcrR family transcriptional regulator [Aquimarina sp. 2304DJ70-9]|uniref:TetR/AcrR family transcriptional regulator n=1 Tax=Aquimarina penaris TaxID=3231044 RepID=UPI0034622CD3